MNLFFGIVLLLLIVGAVLAATAFGISAILRDRRHHGTSGSLGSAMLELQTLIDPAKKQVLEARHELEEAEERDVSGDPPTP
jgi:hypothetical protein